MMHGPCCIYVMYSVGSFLKLGGVFVSIYLSICVISFRFVSYISHHKQITFVIKKCHNYFL